MKKFLKYILAICFALKMSYLETQIALELYPMPVLNGDDLRSSIIISALNNSLTIDELNDWLEKANFPSLLLVIMQKGFISLYLKFIG